MDDKQNISRWMDQRGFSINTLAEAVGMSYSGVYLMVAGERDINDAFKYRFIRSFGYPEALCVFSDLTQTQNKTIT